LANPSHIGQLLRDAFDDFEQRLLAGLREAGETEMRPKYNAALRYLDEEGTRATVLAERSGLTRQALSQIVDEMEAAGYVTRLPDPGDRRAKLVVYTERGLRAFRDSRRVIAEIERDYERRLGKSGYRELRAALAAIRGEIPQP
jgi:DNA-binding MarR family transcriptional regulator